MYVAWNRARAFVAEHGSAPVPMHLRNAPTRLMKGLGYGRAYRYAHDEPGAYAAGERYFPDGVAAQRFYEPVDRGLELRIGEKLASLRERDRAAARQAPPTGAAADEAQDGPPAGSADGTP